jgi:hypothetical protein
MDRILARSTGKALASSAFCRDYSEMFAQRQVTGSRSFTTRFRPTNCKHARRLIAQRRGAA